MQTIANFIKELDALIKRNDELEARLSDLEGQLPTNVRKLSKSDVTKVRELKRAGYKQSEIADIFDVNPATVSRIVRGLYH